MLILIGFSLVSKVNSINGYLLGMGLAFILLTFPPMLRLFNIYENPAFYLWPTQASFVLFDGVFNANSLEMWEIIYGIGFQIVWIVALFFIAKKAFYKYIVQKGV